MQLVPYRAYFENAIQVILGLGPKTGWPRKKQQNSLIILAYL